MMLNDESFAGSESCADVARVEEALSLADGPDEGQRRPEEAMMRSKAPQDDKGGVGVDVLDAHHASFGLEHGQSVNAVTVSHAFPQRSKKIVFGEKRARGGSLG